MGQRGQRQTHAAAALLPACTSPWGCDTEGQPRGLQQVPPSMPSYLCLKTFFSFLEQYPQTPRKSQAAGALRLVLRMLPANLLHCLSAFICGLHPQPQHWGEEANPKWDGSSL